MNLASTLQTEGWDRQQTVSGDQFKLLPGGLLMTGILEPAEDIDPRMELGSDARELSRLHVKRSDPTNQLALGQIDQEDRIAQISAPGSPVWRIVRRQDNPADIVVRFWVVKVTPQDQ